MPIPDRLTAVVSYLKAGGIECEGCCSQPNVVLGRSRYGSVDSKHGDLEALSGPEVSGEDDAVRGIKPRNPCSAGWRPYLRSTTSAGLRSGCLPTTTQVWPMWPSLGHGTL